FIMLTGIGVLLIVLGLFVLFWMRRNISGQVLPATGVVIDQEETDSDGVTYSPIVKFTAHDGTEIIFTDSISTYPAMFKIGQGVKVLYHPENFNQAHIASSVRRNLSTIILLLLGGILLTVGLVCSK